MNGKFGVLPENQQLMQILRAFQEISGLGAELKVIRIVPKGSLWTVYGRRIGGAVQEEEVLLEEVSGWLLMETLIHEYLDQVTTTHAIRPPEGIINFFIWFLESQVYEEKEKLVEGLTKLFHPGSLQRLRKLMRGERPVKKPKAMVMEQIKVLRIHSIRSYGYTRDFIIAEIKNVDEGFKEFPPIKILTAKKLTTGEVLPFRFFDLTPLNKLFNISEIRQSNLNLMCVPVAKWAEAPPVVGLNNYYRGTVIRKRILTAVYRGKDVILPYPEGYKIKGSFDVDIQTAISAGEEKVQE